MHTVARTALRPETRRSVLPFIGYLCFFYLTWTFVWVYGVYPWATETIGAATFEYALINFTFRSLIWILPVFLYLRYVDKVPALEYLQLRDRWRRGVAIGLALSVINFVGTLARMGPPVWSSAHVTWNSILGTSMLVGVFEEIPFRGFILQQLQDRVGFPRALVVSSMLFVLAHVPGWIRLRTLTAHNVVFIFVFGSVMAIILRYSRTLWAPIVTHSLNDGLSHVIFHI
jgi:membrane protease YdiL (CAAX protease family)